MSQSLIADRARIYNSAERLRGTHTCRSRLRTRNGTDATKWFPEITRSLAMVKAGQCVAAASRSKVSVSLSTTTLPSLIRTRAMCATLPFARLRFVMVPKGRLFGGTCLFCGTECTAGTEKTWPNQTK